MYIINSDLYCFNHKLEAFSSFDENIILIFKNMQLGNTYEILY